MTSSTEGLANESKQLFTSVSSNLHVFQMSDIEASDYCGKLSNVSGPCSTVLRSNRSLKVSTTVDDVDRILLRSWLSMIFVSIVTIMLLQQRRKSSRTRFTFTKPMLIKMFIKWRLDLVIGTQEIIWCGHQQPEYLLAVGAHVQWCHLYVSVCTYLL